jgi:hypothetical protein
MLSELEQMIFTSKGIEQNRPASDEDHAIQVRYPEIEGTNN